MTEIVDNVLEGLVKARRTIQKQSLKIGEIMEKSNNTLLQVEAQASLAPLAPPVKDGVESGNIYHMSSDCESSLVTILEQFRQMMQQSESVENNSDNKNVLDSYRATRQRVENLRSFSRKLVALHETIDELKLHVQEQVQLQEQEQEFIKEEKENIDPKLEAEN